MGNGATMATSLLRRWRGLLAAAITLTAGATDNPPQLAFNTAAEPARVSPRSEHPRTSLTIVDQLRRHHFLRRQLDDGLSSELFDKYLEDMDPGRAYFYRADILALEARYRHELDEALREGDLAPAFDIFNLFQERVTERFEHVLSLVGAGLDRLDFALDERLQVERDGAEWPAGREAMDDLWRRRVKAAVLGMSMNGRDLDAIEETLEKRYRNRLKQAARVRSEDAFALYVNAFASTYDPHTRYFSPRTSENFNINMSLSLEGIGAVLEMRDEHTFVRRLVPAGPADKHGGLKASDRIIGVGQGDAGAIVDVVGWRLDEVVALIRGPKGSVVRLEVIGDEDGVAEARLVHITRNTVLLEEQSAQRRILTLPVGGVDRKIGVIEVPTFYADFRGLRTNPNARSSTRDVSRLIGELKDEGVEGIVVDLRNNGGGSLQEAQGLTGLFIESGPVVQVRVQSRDPHIQADSDDDVVWDGPLAVVVNRLSASASEIFAGAIQDYGRGIVTGSRTFGKGTVQTLFPLHRGQLKVTQAKYYLPSGQSTQHQGVVPDIAFPETYDPASVGESALEDAMPWDKTRPAEFRMTSDVTPFLDALAQRHEARVLEDPDFEYLRALAMRNVEERARTHVSLNRETRERERADYEAWRLAVENTLLLAKGEAPLASLDALEEENDNDEAAAGEPPDLGEDPMLRETGLILLDYIGMAQQVAMVDAEAVSGGATATD